MADQVVAEFQEPAQWPKVIGIIDIVWGTLGLLCGVCGGVMMFMPSVMLSWVPEDKRAEVEKQMAANAAWPVEYVLMAFGVLSAVLLLVAGIMLVKRNPGARPLHLVYGVVGVLLTLTNAGIQFVKVPQAVKASVPAGTGEDAIRQGIMMGYVFAAFFILLGIAWPLFCLIWFGMVKRDNRDLTGPVEARI